MNAIVRILFILIMHNGILVSSNSYGSLQLFYKIATNIVNGTLTRSIAYQKAFNRWFSGDITIYGTSTLMSYQISQIVFILIGIFYMIALPAIGFILLCIWKFRKNRKEETKVKSPKIWLGVHTAVMLASFAFLITSIIIYGISVRNTSISIDSGANALSNGTSEIDNLDLFPNFTKWIDDDNNCPRNTLSTAVRRTRSKSEKFDYDDCLDIKYDIMSYYDVVIDRIKLPIDAAKNILSSYSQNRGKNTVIAVLYVIVILPCLMVAILTLAVVAVAICRLTFSVPFLFRFNRIFNVGLYLGLCAVITAFSVGWIVMLVATTVFAGGYDICLICDPVVGTGFYLSASFSFDIKFWLSVKDADRKCQTNNSTVEIFHINALINDCLDSSNTANSAVAIMKTTTPTGATTTAKRHSYCDNLPSNLRTALKALSSSTANCSKFHDVFKKVTTKFNDEFCQSFSLPVQGIWASAGLAAVSFIPLIISILLAIQYIPLSDSDANNAGRKWNMDDRLCPISHIC